MAEPITMRVPLGVTLSQCVAAAGGPTLDVINAQIALCDAGSTDPSTTSAGRCLVLTIPYRPSLPTASGKSAIGDLFLIPAF